MGASQVCLAVNFVKFLKIQYWVPSLNLVSSSLLLPLLPPLLCPWEVRAADGAQDVLVHDVLVMTREG